MTPTDCDFYCGQVLAGKQAVTVCFESERVLAFHHTNPIWEEHVVLLPKQHIDSFLTMGDGDDDLLRELMAAARQIAGDIMARRGGARVYTNMGSYQSARHLHWHIGGGDQLRPY